MAFRSPEVAPESVLEASRRGRSVGRFCHRCKSVFPLHLGVHRGKGIGLFGRDHVVSPCSHEGENFEPGDDWWEPAVEVLAAAEQLASSET